MQMQETTTNKQSKERAKLFEKVLKDLGAERDSVGAKIKALTQYIISQEPTKSTWQSREYNEIIGKQLKALQEYLDAIDKLIQQVNNNAEYSSSNLPKGFANIVARD